MMAAMIATYQIEERKQSSMMNQSVNYVKKNHQKKNWLSQYIKATRFTPN